MQNVVPLPARKLGRQAIEVSYDAVRGVRDRSLAYEKLLETVGCAIFLADDNETRHRGLLVSGLAFLGVGVLFLDAIPALPVAESKFYNSPDYNSY